MLATSFLLIPIAFLAVFNQYINCLEQMSPASNDFDSIEPIARKSTNDDPISKLMIAPDAKSPSHENYKKRSDVEEGEPSRKMSLPSYSIDSDESTDLDEAFTAALFRQHKNMIRFKVEAAQNPHKFQTEYLYLKADFNNLLGTHAKVVSNGVFVSEKSSERLKFIKTLHLMMELHIRLNEEGCKEVLSPIMGEEIGDELNETSQIGIRLTKLENVMRDFIYPCISERGFLQTSKIDCAAQMKSARAQMVGLGPDPNEECTPLSVLFRTLYFGLTEMIRSIERTIKCKFYSSESESEDSPSTDLNFGRNTLSAEKMEALLEYWYYKKPVYPGIPDYAYTQQWRMKIRELADNCFDMAITNGLHDATEMMGVKRYLKLTREYLHTQTSAIVLKAIHLSVNGRYSEEEVREFSVIYEILVSTVRYMGERLAEVFSDIRNLEAEFNKISVYEAKIRYKIEEERFDRVSSELGKVGFTILPEADKVKVLEGEARVVLDRLASLLRREEGK